MQLSSKLTLEEQSSIKRMSPVYLHSIEIFNHYIEVTDMKSRVAEWGCCQVMRGLML